MRALIQRVSTANVVINHNIHSQIGVGLVVLLGIEAGDTADDIQWLVSKITQMRIFGDDAGKMNKSALDANGELLVVSQFTLHASTKKGNRPSFLKAARPDIAIPLYELFLLESGKLLQTKAGVFGADMQVGIVNDGPVTIWLDSKNKE